MLLEARSALYLFEVVANIKQQKKRIGLSERQRLRNRQYTTQLKTVTKKLEVAAAGGDAAAVEVARVQAQHLVDVAAAKGAVHRNTASRRKARFARIAAGAGS